MTSAAQSHQQLNQSSQLHQRLRQSFAANTQDSTQKQDSVKKQSPVKKQDSISQVQLTTQPRPLSTQDKLTLFEQTLAEVEAQSSETTQDKETAQSPETTQDQTNNVLAQAIPQAALQAINGSGLNSTQVATSFKEAEASMSPDISPVEAGAGLQQVEYEKTPEIPTEVESYLKTVESNQDQAPPEIVIADGTHATSDSHQPLKKPVVVLPITQEQEKKGKKKSIHWSIRWLVEWSQRLMKIFKGEIIYRHAN